MRIELALILLLISSAYFTKAQSVKRVGKDYAVFFYNSTFTQGWQPLLTSKTEAEALQQELEANYGFICELVPNPTREQIYNTIGTWNQRIGSEDQVLFFFSSHGYYDKVSKLGYLIPSDGVFNDEYFSTWLDYNSLRPYFARCKARNIIVALDACYSGSFGEIEKGAPGGPDYHLEQDCQAQIDQAFRYKGRLYVCSGNKEARTPGDSRFAAKFLELLRKGPSNSGGIIHFDDLYYALGKIQNPEPVHGDFPGHDPGGDFVFVKKNACSTPPPPDQDGDGVPDITDQCPKTWGSQSNGCPPLLNFNSAENDLAFWKTAKRQNTVAAYQEYLRQFPKGEFNDQANNALLRFDADEARRRDDTAWEVATEKNTAEAYKKYLDDYPEGLHHHEVNAQMNDLEKPYNMQLIEAGTYLMGSTEGESDEKPAHKVTISPFYLGKYEVTVAEFKYFVDATGHKTDAEENGGEGSSFWNNSTSRWERKPGTNWRYDAEGNLRPQSEYNHPVLHVSWHDATKYCQWLSQKIGKAYRLPTEAEWEYAAGNGSRHTKYSWGNHAPGAKKVGNIADEITQKKFPGWTIFPDYSDGYVFTAPVGCFEPNDFGLHDMIGNVWEWCSDWYEPGYYKNSPSYNPLGPISGTAHVRRGGSWSGSLQIHSCVTDRYFGSPKGRNSFTGFRLARSL